MTHIVIELDASAPFSDFGVQDIAQRTAADIARRTGTNVDVVRAYVIDPKEATVSEPVVESAPAAPEGLLGSFQAPVGAVANPLVNPYGVTVADAGNHVAEPVVVSPSLDPASTVVVTDAVAPTAVPPTAEEQAQIDAAAIAASGTVA